MRLMQGIRAMHVTRALQATRAMHATRAMQATGTMHGSIEFPKEYFTGSQAVALDIGGSAIKVITMTSASASSHVRLNLHSFKQCDLFDALSLIRRFKSEHGHSQSTLYSTGVGCSVNKEKIEKYLNTRLVNLEEMTCMTRALRLLLRLHPEADLLQPVSPSVQEYLAEYTSQMMEMKQNRMEILGENGQESDYIYPQPTASGEGILPQVASQSEYPYLLVMLGSGCLIMQVEARGFKVIDTSASCGRTLMAFAKLLANCQDFAQLEQLAISGDHRRVDTTGAVMKRNVSQTSDIYGCIPDDLLMYSFGQVGKEQKDTYQQEDLLRALVVKICSDLAQLITRNHQQSGAKNVYVVGGLGGSPLIRDELATRIGIRNLMAVASGYQPTILKFMRHGAFLGAIGTLMMSRKHALRTPEPTTTSKL